MKNQFLKHEKLKANFWKLGLGQDMEIFFQKMCARIIGGQKNFLDTTKRYVKESYLNWSQKGLENTSLTYAES